MIKKLAFGFVVVFVFFSPLLCSLAFGQQSTETILEEQVLALAKPYVDAGMINCASIGIIDGDTEVTLSVGQFSEEDPTKADQNTIFEIGSISKVFTGVLLADAIERGLVTADQPASELLPEGIAMPVLKRSPEHKITLAQLSTHVSGLPRMPDNFGDSDPKNPYVDYGPKEMFEFLNSYELSRKPGIAEEYSNLGVGLLGTLLAQKQQTDYQSLLQSRITKRLGMNDTATSVDADKADRLAPPHDASCRRSSSWDFDAMAGAGAIRSTVSDMLKFAKANLDVPGGEIGKAIELAYTQQRQPKGILSLPMGFGWMINPGTETHWHNGQTGGYHSIMFVARKKNRALVILSNTATGEIDQLGSEIMQMLDGNHVPPRKFRKSIEVTSELCDRYVGKYSLTEAISFDVAKAKDDDAGLTVQLTGQPAFPIYPESETRWFLKVVEADIEFTVDETGKCVSLTLYQNGIEQTAKKQ